MHSMTQLKNPDSVMVLGCVDVTFNSSRPEYQHIRGFDDPKKVVMQWVPSNCDANQMMFI